MNPFSRLNLFLESFGSVEVEGRAMDELPEGLAAQLQSLAAGTLSASERLELAEILKQNPEWVSYLARQFRLLREGKEPADQAAS